MRKNQVKLIAAGMLVLALTTSCGSGNNNASVNSANDNSANVESEGILSTDMKDVDHNAGEQEMQTDTETEQTEESSRSRSQDTEAADGIEEELAAYRAEREEGVSSSGGYMMVKAPNEENYHYGIGESSSHIAGFDSRELNEIYETAGAYIRDTLNLESEVWGCIDPRMNAIYEDEDKGVASGYDADNIFICEYDDNGNWQYLILVREGKGSDWEVLYHGSSYKTN